MTEPQIPIYLADGMPRRTFLKTLGIASGSLMLSELPSLQAQIASGEREELAMREYLPAHGILSMPPGIQHYHDMELPAYLLPLSFLGVTDDLTGPSRLKENAVSYVRPPSPKLVSSWSD